MQTSENKLVKKLKESQSQIENQVPDQVLESMKTLLLDAGTSDNKVLDQLGLNRNLNIQRHLNEEIFRSKKAKEIYKTNVFSGKIIKNLCNTYYMKILPVERYIGEITSELPRKVSEFCEANKIDLQLESANFFILAPIECFDSTKVKKIEVPRLDPILFYRPFLKDYSSEASWKKVVETDNLVQVYNWGSDFSEMRKFKYLFNNTTTTDGDISMRSKVMISLSLFIIPILLIILGGSFVYTVVSTAVLSILFYSVGVSECNSDDLWNVGKI